MITPEYRDNVTIGGTSQTIQFDALPIQLTSRQSGQIKLSFFDAFDNSYDMSSLDVLDIITVPFESGETETTLATGMIAYTPASFLMTSDATTPPTGGTFTLNVNGEVTSAIAYNATDSEILTALEALASRTAGDFTVNRRFGRDLSTGGAQMQIDTSGSFAIEYPITADLSSLTTATSVTTSSLEDGSDIQNTLIGTWPKDSIPDNYSQYDYDRRGAIAMIVRTSETASNDTNDDWFQVYQRFNVVDEKLAGQQSSSSSLATYLYTPTDSNRWARYTDTVPSDIGSALNNLVSRNFADFGAVTSILNTPPVSPSDGDTYLVGTGTGDWAGEDNQIATYSSALSAWYFSGTHKDGDFLRDLSDGKRYERSGASWVESSGIGTGSVSNTELVDMADGTLKGRQSGAGTGSPQDITYAQVKADMSLDNVNNTSDANKPISTATQSALNGKLGTTAQAADTAAIATVSVDLTGITTGDILKYDGANFIAAAESGGGSGIVNLPYSFSTTTTIGGLATGQIRGNNATPTSITEIYIHQFDGDGIDQNSLINALVGNQLKWKQDGTKVGQFTVNAATDNGDSTFTLGVTAGTQGSLPDNATTVSLGFYYISSSAGSGLTSFNGRSQPAVVPAASDYDASQVDNDSGVTGTFVSDALNTLDNEKIDATQAATGTDNNQTGTTYTFVLTDQENTTVWMNNASANTSTIPSNASVAFPIGTKIQVIQEGAGQTTIDIGSGGTINGTVDGSVVINNQFQGATLSKRGTDTWIITGDIT